MDNLIDLKPNPTATTSPPPLHSPDVLPIPSVLSLPEGPKLPYSFTTRKAGFERLDTRIITAFPRALLKDLTSVSEITPATAKVLEQHGGDRARAIDSLVMFLANPDMVDFALALSPGVNLKNWDIAFTAEEWKRFWINHYSNPDLIPPYTIREEGNVDEYAMAVLPVRLGREGIAQELYALTCFNAEIGADIYALQRDRLTAMNNPAIKSLCNSAELALNLAAEEADPGRREALETQIMDGISQTLEAQDKWWALGAGRLDTLTEELMELIVKRKMPHAASIVLDTLYRKARQDSVTVYGCYYPPENMPLHKTAIELSINSMIDLAIEADQQEVKDYLAHRFGEGGAAALITEEIIGRPRLHTPEIHPGQSREIEYFGKKFLLTGLPDGEDITLKELTFGIYAAEDAPKEHVWLFQTDPSIFWEADTIVSVHPVPIENLVYWTHQAKEPIPEDKMKKFVADFPSLTTRISRNFPDNLYYTNLPLGSIYQLWNYLEEQPPEVGDKVYQYIDQYGPMGIFSFLVGEHEQANISLVIDFAMDTYKPRTREINGDLESVQIRAYDTFTENLISSYTDLYIDARRIAGSIGKTPDQQILIHDLMLQRAKALLVSAARIHKKEGLLSEEDQHYISQSVIAYRIFLRSMIDSTGEFARKAHVPYNLVRKLFQHYDLSDPNSRALYYSMFELWYKSNQERQKLAPYRGKVNDITLGFYRAYEELETDSANTTAPSPELEDARYLGDLEEDFRDGTLPVHVPEGENVTIGFLGAGKLRMEKKIMAKIREITGGTGYKFVAIDINKPEDLPPDPDLSFQQMDMKEVGDAMPDRFTEIYAIWSPLMDVIELDELRMVMASIAKSLKPGGRVKLDVHFPFGIHSYQSLIQEYNQAHPGEPEGMFEREFERGEDKAPLSKRFFASDPFTLIPLAKLFGMKCKYFPIDPREIEALCGKAEADDSFIPAGPQHNMKEQPLYRTEGEGGWNRATYTFVMDDTKLDIDLILSQSEGGKLESMLTLVS